MESSGEEGDAAIPEHIYCKRCGYDLSATHDLVLCPECGKEFDFQHPKSFDRVPRREIRQRAARRILLVLLLTALLMAGLNYTVIPRPISRHHLALWMWFGQPTGMQRSPVIGPKQYEVTWFFGEPRAVRVYRPGDAGRAIAEIRRPSMAEDAFSMRVRGPGVRIENLLYAFNTLRTDDEIFGIQWTRDQPRAFSTAAFAREGTMGELMSGIVGHYGIRVRPLTLGEEDGAVSIFLPDGVVLPDEARAARALRLREAIEAAGIFGPPAPDDRSAIDVAYDAMRWNLRAAPGPIVGDVIDGRMLRVSPAIAEYLGYRVTDPDGPIILQRLDWYSARTGWY